MLEDKITKIRELIMYFMEIESEINHKVSDMRNFIFDYVLKQQ
jgi:hypothetical protein